MLEMITAVFESCLNLTSVYQIQYCACNDKSVLIWLSNTDYMLAQKLNTSPTNISFFLPSWSHDSLADEKLASVPLFLKRDLTSFKWGLMAADGSPVVHCLQFFI